MIEWLRQPSPFFPAYSIHWKLRTWSQDLLRVKVELWDKWVFHLEFQRF